MPTFAYRARSLDGRNVQGELTAASQREAMAMLAQKSLFPLDVTDRTKRRALPELGKKKVKPEQIAAALSQLSDLLDNGVPLLEALELLAEQSPQPALREVMSKVHHHVSEGESLDEAVARYPKVFSSLTVSMIRAGSEGAFLEEALSRVSSFMELQEELKSRLRGAMVYPMILMVVGTIVTLGLVIFFVPKFDSLFQRLERHGTGLPLATKILLGASEALTQYGLVVFGVVAAIVFGIVQLLKTDQGSAWLDRVTLKLPLAGKIFHDTAVSRFCRVLGTLLRNGVPILRALQISSGSVGNQQLSAAILGSAENISSGETLSTPLAESGLIPASTMAMIRIAEESNSLDTVLIKIADSIDRRIEKQLTLMVRFVEPVMLVLIGVAVLFVMVALLLPIIESSTTI